MQYRTAFIIGLIVVGALLTTPALRVDAQGPGSTDACCDFWQPGWMRRHMWGGPGMHPEIRARMQRHWTFMHEGVPKQYQGARSTVSATPENIAAGGQLYHTQCASCHGKKGLGDGEAEKGLSPSPALLAYMIQMPVSVDEYLLWTISEGGIQFGTAMPAFRERLSTEEIWKIVTYMRVGFPKGK